MLRQLTLGFCACIVFVPLIAACGGESDAKSSADDPTQTPVASPTKSAQGTESPKLAAPASKYTLLLADVGTGYFTDRQHTFTLGIDNYSTTPSFPTPAEGKKLLEEWGYVEGFETAYEPEGRQTDVLNGKYYIAVETHLFETEDGAQKAFAYFQDRLRAAGRAEPVETSPLGNESSAWKANGEKIQGSSITATFHRFIVRRGNMVAVVQTWGAETFMRVDTVRGLAAILDEKALGRKDAPEPTPIGQ
jgi:hypothetical protein